MKIEFDGVTFVVGVIFKDACVVEADALPAEVVIILSLLILLLFLLLLEVAV